MRAAARICHGFQPVIAEGTGCNPCHQPVERGDMVRLLARNWHSSLGSLFQSATSHILISSPYVTREGVDLLLTSASREFVGRGTINFLTDLSPLNICASATDPEALQALCNGVRGASVRHLPRVHAKVYVADGRSAIITSANLTAGGLLRNYEYGVAIDDHEVAQRIGQDVDEYSGLGAEVPRDQLNIYCQVAADMRAAYLRTQTSVRREIAQTFAQRFEEAEDQLVRLRLFGGAMHTVFERTILYLLRKHGPLRTVELHPLVARIHPDLCDDRVDRVIDGKRFGKKWKHAVRTAQQNLKKHERIEYHEPDERWVLVPRA